MKLFLTSVAVYLALCDASADSELQTRPSRPSGGGKPGGRLANMIETECSGDFSCDGVDLDNLDCTFERADAEIPDERPDFSSLNSDQRAQLKAELQANKEERRQNMLECACCAGMSVEDILAARGDTDGTRPLGGRPGGRPGAMRGDGSSGGSGRPGMGMAGSSRPQQGSSGGSGRPGMGSFGEGSRPQGGGDGGSGRPDDMDVEAVLAEKCDDFLPKCDSLADQNIDCTTVFEAMSSNTRGGRRRDFLYCGCCVDAGGD